MAILLIDLLVQLGILSDHVPLTVHCLVADPESTYPSRHEYVTELEYEVPSIQNTLPLAGAPGFPHLTAVNID